MSDMVRTEAGKVLAEARASDPHPFQSWLAQPKFCDICMRVQDDPRHIEAEARATADAALREALINAQSERDMAEAYYLTLERHLREHGCDHDFAEVANANGALLTPEATGGEPREDTEALRKLAIDAPFPPHLLERDNAINTWRKDLAAIDPRDTLIAELRAALERLHADSPPHGPDDAPCYVLTALARHPIPQEPHR